MANEFMKPFTQRSSTTCLSHLDAATWGLITGACWVLALTLTMNGSRAERPGMSVWLQSTFSPTAKTQERVQTCAAAPASRSHPGTAFKPNVPSFKASELSCWGSQCSELTFENKMSSLLLLFLTLSGILSVSVPLWSIIFPLEQHLPSWSRLSLFLPGGSTSDTNSSSDRASFASLSVLCVLHFHVCP